MAAVSLPAAEADAELIAASWDDAERFAVLYDRHAAGLHRYAYQRVGPQAAEDVVAETFLAAFQQRRSYDVARPDARPWLFGILTNKLARHLRSEKAQYRALSRSAPTDVAEGPADTVADRVAAAAAAGALAAALARLSKGDRDVLLLIAWGDLSYEEVANALAIPLGTVRSRLNRARRKVRETLGRLGPVPDADDLEDR